MGRRKKKLPSVQLILRPGELLRALRKPRTPTARAFKNKSKYSRKAKHKEDYRREKE